MLELKELFLELYTEWFENKKYWFDKKLDYDIYLSNKYWNFIKKYDKYDNELINEDKNIQIGAIIAFDQIPRHYNRIKNIDVIKYSNIATDISTSLIDLSLLNSEIYNSISAHEWCFIFLPIRHINKINAIQNIIDFLIKKHNNDNTSIEDKNIYKRFLENTLNKYYKNKTLEYIANQRDIYIIKNNVNNQWNKYSDILHHIPSKPIDLDYDNINNYNLIKIFNSELKYIKDENIIVSLSGGVDSVVSLYLIKYFFPNNNIIAVHINYANRKECNNELKFVNKLCAIMNIKLYYRTIDEIKRDDCHQKGLRNLYESITKDIRFDMYKQVSKLYEGNTVILLGHNKDDCFENIITNISLKKNYENLSGVIRLSNISDITFWRPLLNIRKDDIIHFAMNVNLPFLKNSTPIWSSRGKIRDVILPALQNINPYIMESFFDLKEYINTSENIINDFITSHILQQFILYKETNSIVGIFKIHELLEHKNIWLKLFNNSMFQSFFNSYISFKSLNEFTEYIIRFKKNFNNINVNKKIKFILKKNINVIMYKTKNNNINISFMRTDDI